MINRKIISRQSIVSEISEALSMLARDIDRDMNGAIKIASKRLSAIMRSDEVFVLLKLISEQRLHCAMCGIVIPETRASGVHCLACSRKIIILAEEEGAKQAGLRGPITKERAQ